MERELKAAKKKQKNGKAKEQSCTDGNNLGRTKNTTEAPFGGRQHSLLTSADICYAALVTNELPQADDDYIILSKNDIGVEKSLITVMEEYGKKWSHVWNEFKCHMAEAILQQTDVSVQLTVKNRSRKNKNGKAKVNDNGFKHIQVQSDEVETEYKEQKVVTSCEVNMTNNDKQQQHQASYRMTKKKKQKKKNNEQKSVAEKDKMIPNQYSTTVNNEEKILNNKNQLEKLVNDETKMFKMNNGTNVLTDCYQKCLVNMTAQGESYSMNDYLDKSGFNIGMSKLFTDDGQHAESSVQNNPSLIDPPFLGNLRDTNIAESVCGEFEHFQERLNDWVAAIKDGSWKEMCMNEYDCANRLKEAIDGKKQQASRSNRLNKNIRNAGIEMIREGLGNSETAIFNEGNQ